MHPEMFPPSQGLRLDIDAISGICGSISIACWVVVFSPQIIENFRRSSADGLSVLFIVVWLAGDVFNILGAVLQGVLPTMIILAVYYTFADIVLLLQCFYYKGFTLSDEVKKPADEEESEQESEPDDQPTERSALIPGRDHSNGLSNGNGYHSPNGYNTPPLLSELSRNHSHSSFRDRLLSVDGTHLSPATPLRPDHSSTHVAQSQPSTVSSTLQSIIFNLSSIILVCLAGVFGWWLSARNSHHSEPDDSHADSDLHFNVLGQVFGYICAALYLGSRIPQLLLNYRRKSTEGISMLFFLFACIGNLTYVLSIVAYQPICKERRHCRPGEASAIYGRYFAVNFSWLLGSFGTLLLDGFVFVQYFLYKDHDDSDDEGEYER